MVEFAQKTQGQIRLIYYPPYHSKYNPIEWCWSVLENYWNGAILDSIDAALNWASNMTWKGIKPLVVKVLTKELEQLQPFNAAFRNFTQMGCDGSTLLAGILFLRKSLNNQTIPDEPFSVKS